MSAIATIADAPNAVQSYSDGLLEVISRAARDPNVDIDKMERLLQMQERIQARDAKTAYTVALAEMQPLLPIIDRKGRIIVKDKATKEITQSTGFAKWEDISMAITPILSQNGFSLTFENGLADDGRITTTAVLAHRAGHEGRNTVTLAHDSSGSKNAVQAVGSSMSYGKRYSACGLLNIVTQGEDDDGQKAGDPATVDDTQLARLTALASEVEADVRKFCQYLKIDSLRDLPANRFNEAIDKLRAKKAAK
jgi:hypothetical protein